MSSLRRSLIAGWIVSAVAVFVVSPDLEVGPTYFRLGPPYALAQTQATTSPPPAQAASVIQPGEDVYRASCATCHEAGVPRAPNRATLSRLSADNIRNALTQGTMRQQASTLTPAQIDNVVRFLASAEPTATPLANKCAPGRPPNNAMSRPRWNGWGVDATQTRFQPAAMAQLTADQVAKLKVKWAYAFPGVTQAFAQPTIVGDRIFVGSAGRKVYSLNAQTGCEYWTFDTDGPVRAAITIAVNNDNWVAYIADQRANVYAIDALTGNPLWKRKVELFLSAVITGAPTLAGQTLYVGTSSSEEASAVTPTYQCCRFRGSVTALDAVTGEVKWKTYTIPEEPAQVRKNAQGTQLWGPSGAPVWSSPTVDLQAKRVYVTTGDSYSDPAARTSDAFLAFDAETGKMLWSRQMTANDSYTMGCGLPAPLDSNCPQANGPDFDFGSSPMLVTLPNTRKVLIAGQKSGVVHAVDPETGAIMWQRRLGTGGKVGGIQWGSAYDGTRVYSALSDVSMAPPPPGGRGAQPTMLGVPLLLDSKVGGGLWALDPRTGEILWRTPHPGCGDKPGCSPAQSGAVTAIPGVVFSGGLDGHLRAYDAAKGAIIWDIDTIRDYTTVNGVKGSGGSLDGPGVVVVGGMLYANSGYAFIGGTPGNVLLAFSVDGK